MRCTRSRKRPRRSSYDYTLPGAYFVTTITHRRRPILGTMRCGGVALLEPGLIVERWVRAAMDRFAGVTIDTFVVMPDHVHAIVVLSLTPARTVGLSQVIGWIKQRAAREINTLAPIARTVIWQSSFHDSIIRDAQTFDRIRRYVASNPARAWRASLAPLPRPPLL